MPIGKTGSGRALRPESEINEWIIAETRKTPACRDLDLRFTIVRRANRDEEYQPSWDLRAVAGWSGWSSECREAFLSAVRAAQARFDVL